GRDAVCAHLWRMAVAASDHRERFDASQPDALLFQMGKVASLSLQAALLDHGVNCFHAHSLRPAQEAARLSDLLNHEPTFRRAAVDLNMLAKHPALNMLTRWYRANGAAAGHRLKVITLTRDPANRYVSQLLQQAGHEPGALRSWYRDLTGTAAERGGDVGMA